MASIINIGGEDADQTSLINLDIKAISRELSRIPKWMKYLMTLTILIGALYYGVFRKYDINEIETIKEEIEFLNSKLDESVLVSDYLKDYEGMKRNIKILKKLLDYSRELQEEEILMTLEVVTKYHEDQGKKYNETIKKNKEYYQKIEEIYQSQLDDYSSSAVAKRIYERDSVK